MLLLDEQETGRGGSFAVSGDMEQGNTYSAFGEKSPQGRASARLLNLGI